MSTPTTTPAKLFISLALAAGLIAVDANAEWIVDFSRREKQTRVQDMQRAPASTSVEMPVEASTSASDPQQPTTNVQTPTRPGFFQSLFQSGEIAQEIVVLNTDKGFIPSTIRVRKGLNYEIHVVNVNEKEKNVSFVLDSFSEHHATYYGKIKTFVIHPQKEGVYRFISPETSAQGKLVVYPDPGVDNRMPASAD